MSDKMRWRCGDTNPVVAAVDSETVIEIGDLLFQDKDSAKPASMIEIQSRPEIRGREHELMKIALFAGNFLGVAWQRSRNGDTSPIRVATTSVCEFDCPSSTFELGNLMGVWCDRVLKNQGVDEVSKDCPHLAIGRVARREPKATTSVLVDIRSTVMTGGI